MLHEIENKCNTKLKLVTASHAFSARNQDELSFKEGQVIKIIRKQRGGWWVGESKGVIGWFPCNFTVEIQGNPDDHIEEADVSSDEEGFDGEFCFLLVLFLFYSIMTDLFVCFANAFSVIQV